MPTYEYTCKSCAERLEVVQSFSDDPLTECPSCSGQLRKVFQPVGIAFKGSGFYKTDSRSSSKSSSSSGSDATKSDAPAKTEGSKSDSSSTSSTTKSDTSSSSTPSSTSSTPAAAS